MMKTFAEAEAVLATRLPGYAPRPQQQALARAVEQTLATSGGLLLAQAGCGTGKSLGTVIPAILSGKRTIVATATKALQEQYASKDMPFLEQHLGVPFTWALLKGRSNYACAAKLADLTEVELPGLGALVAELDFATHSGDVEHLATPLTEDGKRLITTSSAECPGKSECPFAQACFAEKAKEEAKAAQIVITNTAMLMTELKIRANSDDLVQMLGVYGAVVVDEGHELPEIAANALADQFRQRGIEAALTQVANFFGDHCEGAVPGRVDEARKAVAEVWDYLGTLAQGEQVEIKLAELQAHAEPFFTLVEALRDLVLLVHDVQLKVGHPVQEASRQARLRRRVQGLVEAFIEFLTSDGLVRWAETETVGRGRNAREIVTLKYSPIEVGPFLAANLWGRVPVVLVSATLSVGTDFSYMIETLGAFEPTTLDVGTPFDYAEQAMLFVPDKDQPDPSRDRSAWTTYAMTTTLELVRGSGGGALLLFTSRKAMQDTFRMIAPALEAQGLTCLMQGEHGTNKELARRFAEDTHSVLFALKSFFTGVDFPGEACRLVVIDKLPFPVPSDILFAARSALVERRYGMRSGFDRLSIPMMVLTLVQGIGRLIRSVEDTGAVAILDPRLTSKGYGRKILRSLPPMPLVHGVDRVRDFFARA